MKKTLIVLVAIAAIGLMGWQIVQSQNAAGPMDESQIIVAQYEWNGTQKIPLAALNAMIADEPDYRRSKYESKKDKVTYLEESINEKLKRLAAADAGFDKNEELLKKVENYKHTLMIERLTEIEVDEKISVTDAELRAYYEVHKDEFVQKAKARATSISLTDEDFAYEVLEQIKGGKDIIDMAEELSRKGKLALPGPNPTDPSDTAFFTRNAYPHWQEFVDAVFEAEIGEIPDRVFEVEIEDETYYVFFRKEEYKPKRQQPFEEVKENIEWDVAKEKKRERLKEWVEGIIRKGKIKVYPDRIPVPPPAEEDAKKEKSEE